MKKEELLYAIGGIDPELVAEAHAPIKRKRPWLRYGALAACAAAAVLIAVHALAPKSVTDGETQGSSSDALSISERPYAQQRDFSKYRAELEDAGAIPILDDYPIYSAQANYTADGGIYSIEMFWQRRGDDYSQISASFRDGACIVSAKNADEDKIEAFFRENPLDYGFFEPEKGDCYEYIPAEDFAGLEELEPYFPDLEALGYRREGEEEQGVMLKNGEFYSIELHTVKPGLAGGSLADWYIGAEMDYYEREELAGDLYDLTQERVRAALENTQHITFTWDGYVIKLYIGSNLTPEDAWEIIKSVK